MKISLDQAIEDIPLDTRVVFLPNEGAIILANSIQVACLRAIFLEKGMQRTNWMLRPPV